jgi:uncharacterized protein YndB with AHSA1/START domain
MGLDIGTLFVRRSTFIRAAPARVWEEFGNFERLVAWFGRGHTLEAYEAEVGSTVTLSVEIGGERRAFGGTVLVFEPERELSFESNWHPPHAWPVPMFFTIRLTPLYDGTLVEIFHHGFERLGPEAADNLQGYEAGWTTNHLEALRSIVEA